MLKSDVYLDKGTYGWIVRTAQANLWRLAEWYSIDDLIQDGLLCFYKCRAKYRQFECRIPTATQRRRFMALFKKTFLNYIHDLVAKKHEELPTEDVVVPAVWEDVAVQPVAPLRLLMEQAPREMKQVVALLTSDGHSYLRKKLNRRLLRETTNEKLARVLSLPEADFTGNLIKYVVG